MKRLTQLEKAKSLYQDAYRRWCYELSHDKNVSIAKNICEYICDQAIAVVLEYDCDKTDGDLLAYWKEVKLIIQNKNHKTLYNG